MRIIDSFMFFDENMLLDIRLMISKLVDINSLGRSTPSHPLIFNAFSVSLHIQDINPTPKVDIFLAPARLRLSKVAQLNANDPNNSSSSIADAPPKSRCNSLPGRLSIE